MRYFICLIVIFCILESSFGQTIQTPNSDRFGSFYYVTKNNINQLEVCVSLIAQFTSGINTQQKVKLGIGSSVSYSHRNLKTTTGIDLANNSKKKIGLDIFYLGIGFDDKRKDDHSIFYLNYYFGEYAQWSGMISLQYKDFQIRFEDDLFGLFATRFKLYDRYRSAALEFRYRYFILGANVFTSDVNGLVDAAKNNKLGTYYDGEQYDSPIYIGGKYKDLFTRAGWNNKIVGEVFQNFTHQKLFNTPNFKTQDYNSLFLQGGAYKPYSLY